jgi:hypothetical protein
VEEVRAVDRALEDYYEKGHREGIAFRELGPALRSNVLDSLEKARRAWQPRPLIPKLGSATLGLDLDP